MATEPVIRNYEITYTLYRPDPYKDFRRVVDRMLSPDPQGRTHTISPLRTFVF